MIAIAKMEMNPTAADTLNGVPVTTRASTPPKQASGTCAINISVLTIESVAAYNTAMISSKATAVMLTPVLSSYLLRTGMSETHNVVWERLHRFYHNLFIKILRWPYLTLAVIALVMANA